VFVPNAKIVKRNGVVLWRGDLDLALDKAKLLAIARRLRIHLYVLYEGDKWYGNSTRSRSDWKVSFSRAKVRVEGFVDALF
jgi:hypothetical protein